ncbi:unnamed protein product [Zymoseptoria tritici ST99CH_1A5]|uniref:BTB domain-containing protein n=1 Tax=Zymoseptoria tritici ST99CH_1A5 TaxID=1276529 RepID=A0A1Y6LVU5_ZYMTR|nr:unnamed protein product [Zymoseptoria tritici ST99CH_1A5]
MGFTTIQPQLPFHPQPPPPPPSAPFDPRTDMTILIGMHHFHAHSSLLISRSEEFANLLGPESNFFALQQEILSLPAENPDVVDAVLRFLYIGDYDEGASADRTPGGSGGRQDDFTWHLAINAFAHRYAIWDLANLALERFREVGVKFLHTTGRIGAMQQAQYDAGNETARAVIAEVMGLAREGVLDEMRRRCAWEYDLLGGGGELCAVRVCRCGACGRRVVLQGQAGGAGKCCGRVMGGVLCWVGGGGRGRGWVGLLGEG